MTTSEPQRTVGIATLAYVGVKVVGVVLVFHTLAAIVGWFGSRFASAASEVPTEAYAYFFTSGLYIILLGAFALACLFNTDRIVGWLFSERRDQELQADARDLQVAAFSIIGLWLVATSLPWLVQGLAGLLWHLEGERRRFLGEIAAQNASGYMFSFAQCAVGLLVLRFARPLAALALPVSAVATPRSPGEGE